ncbi:hypothetical protein EVA_14728 [gut metagenome]|uniref:Uncharacterized protein n=1 Tax=gut metagenome TaxID=749906 RepID=J9CB80_9ZZZZ
MGHWFLCCGRWPRFMLWTTWNMRPTRIAFLLSGS